MKPIKQKLNTFSAQGLQLLQLCTAYPGALIQYNQIAIFDVFALTARLKPALDLLSATKLLAVNYLYDCR